MVTSSRIRRILLHYLVVGHSLIKIFSRRLARIFPLTGLMNMLFILDVILLMVKNQMV